MSCCHAARLAEILHICCSVFGTDPAVVDRCVYACACVWALQSQCVPNTVRQICNSITASVCGIFFIYFLNSGLFLCAQAAQLSGSGEMGRSCRAALHHHHHHHRRRWEERGRQHRSLPVTMQDFLPHTHSHKSTAAAVGL